MQEARFEDIDCKFMYFYKFSKTGVWYTEGMRLKNLPRFLTLVENSLNTVTEVRLYVEGNGMTSKILSSESCMCRFAFMMLILTVGWKTG